MPGFWDTVKATAKAGAKKIDEWALEPMSDSKLYPSTFSYEIRKNGTPVGEVSGNIVGGKAKISWMGMDDTKGFKEKLTPEAMSQLREQFRKDFPKVDTFEGQRISGAKSQQAKKIRQQLLSGEINEETALSQLHKAFSNTTQTIKIPAIAAALGIPLTADSDEAEAANAKHFLGKWGLTDNVHALAGKDVREGADATARYYSKLGIRNHFQYEIKNEGKDVGVLQGFVRIDPKKPEEGPVATIMWVGGDKAKRSAKGGGPEKMEGSGEIHPGIMKEVLRKLTADYPDLTAIDGHRLTGSQGGETVRFKIPKSVKAGGTGAAGFAATMSASDDEAEAAPKAPASTKGGKVPTLSDLPLPPEEEAPTEEQPVKEESNWRQMAMMPLDVLAFNATGMRAEEAVETAKEGYEMAKGAGQQIAEALTPESVPPPGVEEVPEDADLQAPPGTEIVHSNPNTPTGFWDKVTGRLSGSDIGREDPAIYGRMSSQIAGGVGGAYALGSAAAPAGPVAAAAGTVIGGLAGVTAGSLFPEATMEFLEKVGAVEPGYRQKHGLTNEELKTLTEGEMLLDVVTGGGVTAATTLSRGVSRLFTGPTGKSRQLAEDALNQGIALMPVQVGDRAIGRGFVNVFGRVPFLGGSRLKKIGVKGAQRLQEVYQKLPAEIAPAALASDVHAKVLTEVSDTVNRINDQFVPRFQEVMGRPDVSVNLKHTGNAILDMVDDVGALIPSKSPQTGKRVRVEMPGRVKELQNILDKTLKPLVGQGETTPQTLKQTDNLLTVLDKKIAEFGKKGDIEAVDILGNVRTAIQRDMAENLGGKGAPQAAADLKRLSEEYSLVTDELFTNAVANKMGVTPAEGFRAMRFTGDQQKIADTIGLVMRSDDPGMVKDLSRILKPDQMKELTASVFKDRIDDAFVRNGDGTVTLHPERFAKSLGLDVPGSAKYQQTEALLEAAGGALKMDDLLKLDEIAKSIAGTPLPDISTFVARRATLSGLRGALTSLLPTMMISGAGGAAAGAATNIPGVAALTGGLMLRMINHSLANPSNARALRKVLDEKASTAVRWAAYNRLGRLAIEGMSDSFEIDDDTKARYKEIWDMIGVEARRAGERLKNGNQVPAPKDAEPVE